MPVSLMVHYQLVLVVNPALPANNVAELIALAKAKPDTLTYGSSGAGGASHLAMEQFKSRTGTSFTHVPYKGNAPAMADLIGGQITAIVDAVAGPLPLIRAGKIKALGVAASHRSVLLPDVPAISETVPGFEMVGWLGIVAPAGTPPDRVAWLSKEIAAAMNTPAIKQRLTETGNEGHRQHPGGIHAVHRVRADEIREADSAKQASRPTVDPDRERTPSAQRRIPRMAIPYEEGSILYEKNLDTRSAGSRSTAPTSTTR
jgi:tripartite-type tricarboxylate transporter receptor subunit TctC